MVVAGEIGLRGRLILGPCRSDECGSKRYEASCWLEGKTKNDTPSAAALNMMHEI